METILKKITQPNLPKTKNKITKICNELGIRVNKGLQKLPKSDKNELRPLVRRWFLMLTKFLRKTLFHHILPPFKKDIYKIYG